MERKSMSNLSAQSPEFPQNHMSLNISLPATLDLFRFFFFFNLFSQQTPVLVAAITHRKRYDFLFSPCHKNSWKWSAGPLEKKKKWDMPQTLQMPTLEMYLWFCKNILATGLILILRDDAFSYCPPLDFILQCAISLFSCIWHKNGRKISPLQH